MTPTKAPDTITLYVCDVCGLRSVNPIGFHREGSSFPGINIFGSYGRQCPGYNTENVYTLDALERHSTEDLLNEVSRRERTPYVSAAKACKAIFDWLDCITAEHLEPPLPEGFRDEQLHEIAKVWSEHSFRIRLASAKSALLNRTFYGGGEVRKTKCPKHKGHWWGIGSPNDCDCVDEYGNCTGWLPNQKKSLGDVLMNKIGGEPGCGGH